MISVKKELGTVPFVVPRLFSLAGPAAACPAPREPASPVDVLDDWEYGRGGRGRNERLGVIIWAPDGRFRRLGDKKGRFERLGDRKRFPIVQNVHETHQMTPNRLKRPW